MEPLFRNRNGRSAGHTLSNGGNAVCEEADKKSRMQSAAVAASHARRTVSRATLCAVLSALAGCAAIENYAPLVTQMGVYKLDINQGNFISQDMVDKLKNGMTRQQVRLVL
ncbi:MAG: outer membrane protein assembly factor BamE, partial [Pseudomonadota bacterium]|nr:outer membrane protein assembly factor BamE [Pseudomonadota bacterium]